MSETAYAAGYHYLRKMMDPLEGPSPHTPSDYTTRRTP